MLRNLRPTLVVVVGLLLCVPVVTAAQSPDQAPSTSPVAAWQPGSVTIELVPFADGLEAPVFATHDGTSSGVMYVVEQVGTVRGVAADGTVMDPPLLDISGLVRAEGEQGLLGLAFHPDYGTNGRIFVYYTPVDGSSQVVSEFLAAEGIVDPASERVILQMPDFAGNHNGGMLVFDTAGMLLIGTGDGGGGGDPEANGQDESQLLGKLLRIDVDGAAPYEVPVNDPAGRLGPGARPEIRATGLRNPWRFSVDRATGDVFIGDVGQGDWEEISVLPVGQGGHDLGWNVMEGPACYESDDCDQTGLTLPVAWYDHTEGGCTVIGGYVYRGTAYPELSGAYILGDYCSGQIWLLSAAEAISTGVAVGEKVGLLDGRLTSFAETEDGELLAIDGGGRLLRVTATQR
ncbi:MAG: PQQ-dependent sugar dehydrogenase [Chloroflexi bacterium]|nr:PQQ-dependent sugar dehydrogenase [Chloroflexota bacterium]